VVSAVDKYGGRICRSELLILFVWGHIIQEYGAEYGGSNMEENMEGALVQSPYTLTKKYGGGYGASIFESEQALNELLETFRRTF
jgi:hypothetical protein